VGLAGCSVAARARQTLVGALAELEAFAEVQRILVLLHQRFQPLVALLPENGGEGDSADFVANSVNERNSARFARETGRPLADLVNAVLAASFDQVSHDALTQFALRFREPRLHVCHGRQFRRQRVPEISVLGAHNLAGNGVPEIGFFWRPPELRQRQRRGRR